MEKNLNIFRIKGQNVISIKDTQEVLKDAMSRCTKGSDIYKTYQAMYQMFDMVNEEYESEFEVSGLEKLNLDLAWVASAAFLAMRR